MYVVATPIGNLGDLSPRAVEVLQGVDRIAAEDTRHSRRLLQAFTITTPCVALHEHNEREQVPRLVARLEQGESLALISDAGTPLVSDPGFMLVRAAHRAGIRVLAVPGPSALLAALSVSGLPTDRFVFEGFLPPRAPARRERLARLAAETRTLVFYEAPHRISATLADMITVIGGEREAAIARELTKLHETVRAATLQELAAWLEAEPGQRRGEFVVMLAGAAPARDAHGQRELERILSCLLAALPLKQAVAVARELTGERRNRLYELAVALEQGRGAG